MGIDTSAYPQDDRERAQNCLVKALSGQHGTALFDELDAVVSDIGTGAPIDRVLSEPARRWLLAAARDITPPAFAAVLRDLAAVEVGA